MIPGERKGPEQVIEEHEQPLLFAHDMNALADFYLDRVIEHTPDANDQSFIEATTDELVSSESDPGLRILIAAQYLAERSLRECMDSDVDETAPDVVRVRGRMRQLDETMPVAVAERLAVLRSDIIDVLALPPEDLLDLLLCDAYDLLTLREVAQSAGRHMSPDEWLAVAAHPAKQPLPLTLLGRELDTPEKAEALGLDHDVVAFLDRARWHRISVERDTMAKAMLWMTDDREDWTLRVPRREVIEFISRDVRIAPEALAANMVMLMAFGDGDSYKEILSADPALVFACVAHTAGRLNQTIDSLSLSIDPRIAKVIAGKVASLQTRVNRQPMEVQLKDLASYDAIARDWLGSLEELPEKDDEVPMLPTARMREGLSAFLQAVSHDDGDGTATRVYTHRLRKLGIKLPDPDAESGG